jgi:hypothetical protein
MESIILNHEHFVQLIATIYKHLGSIQGLYISYMHTQLVEGQIQGSLICPMDEELEMK